MADIILLIFEGEKTEQMICNNMKKLFFISGQETRLIAYGADIYQLWQMLKDDPYIDIVALLQKKFEKNDALNNISRDDVADIHLFFDHDAHSHAKDMTQEEYNGKIRAMLNIFNDAHGYGKLWISYPMVEALKHIKRDADLCFEVCIWPIHKNKEYKAFVDKVSDYKYIRSYTNTDWYWFIMLNLQKAYCLVDGQYKIADYNDAKKLFDQILILDKQMERFILPNMSVVVLSAFPFFLLYFFGQPLYRKAAEIHVVKPCGFKHICNGEVCADT